MAEAAEINPVLPTTSKSNTKTTKNQTTQTPIIPRKGKVKTVPVVELTEIAVEEKKLDQSASHGTRHVHFIPSPSHPLSELDEELTSKYDPIEGVPIGLEPFFGTDTVTIQQRQELFEDLILLKLKADTNVQYNLYNAWDQRMYYGGEQVTEFKRRCFGPSRPFVINLFNNEGDVAVIIERRCNCLTSFWGATLAGTVIQVKSGFTEELYGTVVQNYSFCWPSFFIKNENGKKVMMIQLVARRAPTPFNYELAMVYLEPEDPKKDEGPNNHVFIDGSDEVTSQSTKSDFEITRSRANFSQIYGQDTGKLLVGVIKKGIGVPADQNLNYENENENEHIYGIEFLPSIKPQLKAVLIAATFAIDFSFFETNDSSDTPFYDRLDCTIFKALVYLIVFLIFVLLVAIIFTFTIYK